MTCIAPLSTSGISCLVPGGSFTPDTNSLSGPGILLRRGISSTRTTTMHTSFRHDSCKLTDGPLGAVIVRLKSACRADYGLWAEPTLPNLSQRDAALSCSPSISLTRPVSISYKRPTTSGRCLPNKGSVLIASTSSRILFSRLDQRC